MDAYNGGSGGPNERDPWGTPEPRRTPYQAPGTPSPGAYPGYMQTSYGGPPNTPGGGGLGAVGLGLAIVGLVLSIVASLVIAYGLGALVMEEIETQTILWVGLGLEVFSLALAITGTVLGVKARKQMPPGRQGLGTAAMVFGIIGIALSAILTVACGCAVGAIAVSFNSGDWEDIVRYSIY